MKIHFKKCKEIISAFLVLVFINSIGTFSVKANINNNKVYKSVESSVSFQVGNHFKNNTAIKVKSKLDTKLLKITGKQNLAQRETKESLKSEMKASNQFVSKNSYIKNDKNVAVSDLVFIYIKTKSSEGIKKVKSYIFKTGNEDIKNKTLAAWVAVNKLEELEALDEVLEISTVTEPKVNISSEGDVLHRANIVRSLSNGSDGSGIKIGVISDGVDHISQSILMGELPSMTHVLSNTVGGDEGTAMLEIIHDLAPGAELYFHDCSSNKVGFNSAVDDLVNAGCKIIVDDIGWFDEPYFEDGIIASHIKQVVDNYGINYISAAGNSAQSHYQGMYHNDGSNWEDFSNGTSNYKSIYVEIQPGETIQAFLQWDDPMGQSVNDYDLYIYDNSTGNTLSYSAEIQNGNDDPMEIAGYTNNSSTAITAEIDVNNYNGAAQKKNLELYVWGNCNTNNIISSDSIFGQAAVPEVIAAGAINVSSPNTIASYSSRGPVTMRTGIKRQKPDVCGASGVSVSGVGGFQSPFYGTSAAAPHIAAIAALLWSEYPEKTSIEIRDLILNNSIDLGTSGVDNIYGHGRADAYNAFIAGIPDQNIPVTGVSLDKTSASIKTGESINLTAAVNPENASTKSLTWTSSNKSAAIVDNTGKVTATGNGRAVITVKTDDGGHTADCFILAGSDYYINTVNFVTRFYHLCLGRDPDQTGLNYWVNGLVSKTFTGADIAYNFIFCSEFTQENVSDSDFIDIMYQTFFNRSADIYGKAYWLERLTNGNSRLYVLSSFVNSLEFNNICSDYGINKGSIKLTKPTDLYPNITEFVFRLYAKCLERNPDNTGLNYYVYQLAAGNISGTDGAYNFIFSPELTEKNLLNDDFVKILYRTLLNREPDSGGLVYHVNRLNSGISRVNEFYVFANSPEFAQICSSYGISAK